MASLPAQAQVGLQVRSGTVWGASTEVTVSQPASFRWRWDGAAMPSRVVWQIATEAPTSTATTRARDAVAREGALGVPRSSGTYQPFSITPDAKLPNQFYVRVQVEVDRKSVYSRWVGVRVLTRADTVAVDLRCSVEAFERVPNSSERKRIADGGTAVYENVDGQLQFVLYLHNSGVREISAEFEAELEGGTSHWYFGNDEGFGPLAKTVSLSPQEAERTAEFYMGMDDSPDDGTVLEFFAEIDPNNRIAETNETNNGCRIELTAVQP
jgi:hypothetical protein